MGARLRSVGIRCTFLPHSLRDQHQNCRGRARPLVQAAVGARGPAGARTAANNGRRRAGKQRGGPRTRQREEPEKAVAPRASGEPGNAGATDAAGGKKDEGAAMVATEIMGTSRTRTRQEWTSAQAGGESRAP